MIIAPPLPVIDEDLLLLTKDHVLVNNSEYNDGGIIIK